MRFRQSAAVRSCDSASLPFAPRSGEKVVRQHRMRGRGRWGAIDVAVAHTHHFIRLIGEAEMRPSSAAAAAASPRRHGEKGQACAFSNVQLAFLRRRLPSLRPAQRGEGGAAAPDEGRLFAVCNDGGFLLGICSGALPHAPAVCLTAAPTAPHPRLPPHLLPVATGRRDRHALSRMCSLHSCDDACLPFAPRSGEKDSRRFLQGAAVPACRRARRRPDYQCTPRIRAAKATCSGDGPCWASSRMPLMPLAAAESGNRRNAVFMTTS